MSKAPRFPQLTMDQLDKAQKPFVEEVMKVFKPEKKGGGGPPGIGGPYNSLLPRQSVPKVLVSGPAAICSTTSAGKIQKKRGARGGGGPRGTGGCGSTNSRSSLSPGNGGPRSNGSRMRRSR